jgi:ABC-type sulfate/molybdate transport systems ATPase subunit
MDVSFHDVRVQRDGRDVLEIPALSMRPGRVTAVLGPNGAGKTTLLRLVAGLERPQSGRVLVGGAVADARHRHVSYAFQENVFLRRSLRDNIELGLSVRGLGRAEAHARALASLRLLDIEALADRRADQMSGGEARRASLARALCLQTPVLLLDEPLAGLDGRTYERLLDELPPILAGSRATTLVVTHRRDEAFRVCDDVVVLIRGHVRATGPKHDISSNPRHADVAEVLGYTVVDLAGRRVAIPQGALSLDAGPTPLAATVETVVDLVDEWDVMATVHETRVHVRVPRAQRPPRAGDRVYLQARAMHDVS